MADRLSWDLQYDDQGRPFYATPDHPQRRYVSPVAMGTGQRPEDTTSIFHKRPEWNAETGSWDTPFDWGNLLNLGVGAGLGAGVLDAIMAPAVGAGGTLPSSTIPGAAGATIPTVSNQGVSATVGGLGGTLPSSAIPAAAGAIPPAVKNQNVSDTVRTVTPNIPKTAATRDSDPNSSLPDWLKKALGIGLGGASVINGMRQPSANKGIEELLGIATDRVKSSQPLFEALQSMAGQSLPTYARTK